MSWPPTSQTVKQMFLYSTVSTLNPTGVAWGEEAHHPRARLCLLHPPTRDLQTRGVPPSHLFSRLSSPSSPSLSTSERCSRPFAIAVALHWTHSSVSQSLLHWGAQHQTQHPEVSQQSCAEGQELLSQPTLRAPPSAAPGLVAPSHKRTRLVLALGPPGPPGPPPQSHSPPGTRAWGCSSPRAGLGSAPVDLHEVPLPFSPACPDPPGRQHDPPSVSPPLPSSGPPASSSRVLSPHPSGR